MVIFLEVIVHYPETKDEKENLKRAVADIHVDIIKNYISKLNCSSEEKKKIIQKIISEYKK